jgi:hypothetical protein
MSDTKEDKENKEVNKTLEFYKRLANLFRSGINIKRKLKGLDYGNLATPQELALQGNIGYPSYNAYRHSYSGFVGMGYFGIYDRIYRYREYIDMDAQSPECSTALDVLADEICAVDQNDQMLHIETDSIEIRKSLEELFFDVCKLNSDLRYWVRSMLKFGDFFLFMDVREKEGIVNVEQIPAPDCERQEKFDKNDPDAVRFKITSPNIQNPSNQNLYYLENFQVANFRFLSNDAYRPHGTSWLDAARRPYRVLMMLIDAMLTYRIVRSPARRLFYIDTTGINPNDVETFMRKVEESFNAKSIVSNNDGRQDYRWNPSSMLENYFIPIKRDSLTKVETLEGATHQTAVDDIAFVHKQLTSALKMPRAFLGYDDAMGKNNLSAQDIRFSKTISVIQRMVLAELKRMAIIHLYARGFDGEDLINFNLKLTNPSTAAVLQKLELWDKKLDIAGKAKDLPHVDEEVIQKEIFGFNDADIIRIRLGREQDTIRNKTFEALQPVKDNSGQEPDQFDPSNYDVPGIGNISVPQEQGIQQQQQSVEVDLKTVPQIDTSDSEIVKVNLPDKKVPIKPNYFVPSKMFPSMVRTSNFNKQIINPYYGMNMISSQKTEFETLKDRDKYYTTLIKESFKNINGERIPSTGIYKEVVSSLKALDKFISESRKKQEIEETEVEIEIENSDFKPFYNKIKETTKKTNS